MEVKWEQKIFQDNQMRAETMVKIEVMIIVNKVERHVL